MNYTLVAAVCCSLVLGVCLRAETTDDANSATPPAAVQGDGATPSLPQSATAAQEEQKGHPFAHIVERNVFALKPPPPPPDPNDQPPPPPPPLAKVVLTGILNVLGPPRALLEVTETEPGKQPTQGQPKKPILREGERDGSIEVISIDVEKSMVRIKNGGFETNLTFVELKQSGGGPAPIAPPPALNASIPAPTGASAAYQPSSSGRGVVMGGATQLAANNPSYNNNSANPPALGAAQFQRQLRVAQTQPQQQTPQVDAATQMIELAARRAHAQQNNQLFPPLPPLPGIDDQPPPVPAPDTPPPQSRPPGVPGLPGFPPLPPVPPR